MDLPPLVFSLHDGDAGMADLLGGKGANLGEMTQLGLPVPPRPTSSCGSRGPRWPPRSHSGFGERTDLESTITKTTHAAITCRHHLAACSVAVVRPPLSGAPLTLEVGRA